MIFLFEKVSLYCWCQVKTNIMYTLDCSYYTRSFESIDALLDDVIISGMDPNYEILLDGEPTGETAWDLIEP